MKAATPRKALTITPLLSGREPVYQGGQEKTAGQVY